MNGNILCIKNAIASIRRIFVKTVGESLAISISSQYLCRNLLAEVHHRPIYLNIINSESKTYKNIGLANNYYGVNLKHYEDKLGALLTLIVRLCTVVI